MNTTFSCPHCGIVSNIEPAHVGKTGPCKGCGKTVTVPFPKAASLPPTSSARGSSTPWIVGCAIAAVIGFIVLGLLACGGLALFGFRSQQMQIQQELIRAEQWKRGRKRRRQHSKPPPNSRRRPRSLRRRQRMPRRPRRRLHRRRKCERANTPVASSPYASFAISISR
jgi:hypothetical protein